MADDSDLPETGSPAGIGNSGTPLPAPHGAEVFAGADFVVVSGANQGDTLDMAADAVAGDVYQLRRGAVATTLLLVRPAAGGTAPEGPAPTHVAAGSEVGAAGDTVRLHQRMTLMAPDGDASEILILELAARGEGAAPAVLVLPLSPIQPRVDYTLLRIEDDPEPVRLSDIICISFGAGTLISLSDGRQVPIESLSPGDRILTRDHGPQPLRWLGRATLRGIGSFAPVVITSGTLGNDGDLVVSQHHRLFIYQRRRSALTQTPELLVQARDLVDDEKVLLRPGGFVDYYSLAFDRHEIVYAHGIPCESLMITEATVARLPESLAAELKARFPHLSQAQHYGQETSKRLLDAIGRGAIFQAGSQDKPR